MPDASPAPDAVPTCYRHPDRETYVRCTRCDRSICPDCMHSASVGFQCPECVKEGNRSVRQRQTLFGGKATGDEGVVTKAIIALCVVVYLLQISDGSILARFADLPARVVGGDAQGVAAGEYYRLLTAAFLHGSVLHIAFNMYALFAFGTQVENALGRSRYVALYLVTALGGSTLSYLLADVGPTRFLPVDSAPSVGASGAVFGLLGAYYVIAKRLRADTSQIVGLVVINLFLGFAIPNIDNWAHIGGLVTGLAITAALAKVPRGPRRGLIQGSAIAAVAVLLVVLVGARTSSLRSEFPQLTGVPSTVVPAAVR